MTKPHILLINPNTSPHITDAVQRLAEAEAGEQASIAAVTANFGARYISSLASFSIAGHAVLDAYATALAAGPRPDAVVVGCFGDPGIEGLREIVDIPVIGFAESGMLAAAVQPGRFIIATVGVMWQDMLIGMAQQRGIIDRLAGVVTIDAWVSDPALAAREIERAANQLGAERVVIGGTGLIPVMPRIAEHLEMAMIDPHRGAVHEAIAAARLRRNPSTPRADDVEFLGLSDALRQVLMPIRAAGASF